MLAAGRGRRRVASLLAFGLHIPDLSTQSRLVTSESVPNLIGLAVGAGGESEALHTLLSARCSACRCSPAAGWRGARRDAITASGWASVALLVTLSWVLPWYVLWVLPLAALSSSRRLRAACAGARRLPDHRLGAGVAGCCGTRSASTRRRRRSGACTSATSGAAELASRRRAAVAASRRPKAAVAARACAAPRGASPASRRSREAASGASARRLRGTASARARRSARRSARARGCAPGSARPGRRRRPAGRRARAAARAGPR